VFVQCGHFADKERRGSADANVRTFWWKKLQIFRCERTDSVGGGLSQFGYFSDKGGGESTFLDFVRTSFMDWKIFFSSRKTAKIKT